MWGGGRRAVAVKVHNLVYAFIMLTAFELFGFARTIYYLSNSLYDQTHSISRKGKHNQRGCWLSKLELSFFFVGQGGAPSERAHLAPRVTSGRPRLRRAKTARERKGREPAAAARPSEGPGGTRV